MAIEKKLICFARLEEFERQLAAGNILDYSIVFIQDAKKIWTHGEFYHCSQTDLSEYLTADEIAEVYATTTQLSGKQDTISDLDTIRSGAAKGATALQSYTEKYTGTITGITMNGASKGTSGVVNLGTVITEHQTLKTINGKSIVGSGDITISVANLSVSITWSELKALRDAGKLVPGIQYRITDYTCTTTQENTKSAGHIFDIIVTADDESTLNEVARAVKHEGDTYFANSNLSAWKIWYCLDNDTNKFVWADATNGKGVIYRMIDEWNNDCPYDFKNMMFEVYYDDDFGAYKVGAKDNSEWSYTFCMIDRYDNKAHDVSVEQYKYTGDEGFYYHTHDNRMLPYYDEYANASGESNVDNGAYVLNANVFVTDTDICSVKEDYSYSEFYAFCNNTLGNGCYYNTFGNDCGYNTFGNGCYYNTFGNNCGYNAFGDSCYGNTFGNACNSNTFGNGCYYNTFGNDCGYNAFGDICCGNTFGNACNSNTFGNKCYNNTFGDNCGYNAFGNDCGYNTFGNGCYYNTFGNNCGYNTFGNYIQESQFGDGVQRFGITTQHTLTKPTASNTKSYIRWLIVESGVRYVNVYVTTSTSSSSYCQNVRICQGCSGINSRTYKSFEINNVGGSRQLIVCYDTSGTLRTGNIGNLLAKL